MMSWALRDLVSDDSLEQFSELGCLVDEGAGLRALLLMTFGGAPLFLECNRSGAIRLAVSVSSWLRVGGGVTRLIFQAAVQYIHLEKYVGSEFRGEVFPCL